MNRFEEISNEMYVKAERAMTLGLIYNSIEKDMQWNAMVYHCADEEHDDIWFAEPTEDDGSYYNKYIVYQEVLKTILKMAEKN